MKPSDEAMEGVREIERTYRSGVFPREAEQQRNRLLSRAFMLRQLGTRGRDGALDDLNDAGFFHVQPCYCEKCDLSH